MVNDSHEEEKLVRFKLYLPRDAYDVLEELRLMTGKRTIQETLRAALKVYSFVQLVEERQKRRRWGYRFKRWLCSKFCSCSGK